MASESKEDYLLSTVIDVEVVTVATDLKTDDVVSFAALNVFVFVQNVVQENYEDGEMFRMAVIVSIVVGFMLVLDVVVAIIRSEHDANVHLLQTVIIGIGIVNY